MSPRKEYTKQSQTTSQQRQRRLVRRRTNSIKRQWLISKYESSDSDNSMELDTLSVKSNPSTRSNSIFTPRRKGKKGITTKSPIAKTTTPQSRRRQQTLQSHLASAFKNYPNGMTRADLVDLSTTNEIKKARVQSPVRRTLFQAEAPSAMETSNQDVTMDDAPLSPRNSAPYNAPSSNDDRMDIDCCLTSTFERLVAPIVNPLVDWTLRMTQDQEDQDAQGQPPQQYQPGAWRNHVVYRGEGGLCNVPEIRMGDTARYAGLLEEDWCDADADVEDN